METISMNNGMPQILYINSQNSAKDAQVIIEDNISSWKELNFFWYCLNMLFYMYIWEIPPAKRVVYLHW